MRYLTGVGNLELRITVRHNFAPIFYDVEKGVLRTRYRLVETDPERSVFEWIDEDGEAREDAYINFNSNGRGGVLIVKWIGRLCGPVVSVEPWERGFALVSGRPDPGADPQLMPVFMARKRIRDTRLEKTRSVALPSEATALVVMRGFKALSHVGGSTFKFTADPYRERRPYLNITLTFDKKKEKQYPKVLIYLSRPLLYMMGIEYEEIGCLDIIGDISDSIYVRLNPPEVCGDGKARR